MHQRAALCSREDRLVDRLGIFFFAEDQAASRSAERLVRRAGYDVSVVYRILVETCRYQTCNVSHVNHEECTDFVCDLTEDIETDLSRISGCSANDQLRLVLASHFSYVVVVDHFRFRIQSVLNEVI